MKARHVVLVALASAVVLASVATASPDAASQHVAITSKLYPEGTFVFAPVTAGALKRDSGTVSVEDGVFTFKGKRGTLTIRVRGDWVDVSNENVNGIVPAVAIGPWKVVRGTGQYARVTGGGRSAQAGMGREWLARQEGFLTSP
jgi:hypothetical protein